MSFALVVGSILALAALGYVLAPIFLPGRGRPGMRLGRVAGASGLGARLADGGQSSAIDVLREVEFDRETGKLSERDYAELKSEYTALAVAELRSAGAAGDSDRGAAVQATKGTGCRSCGAKTSTDASYCDSCGVYLAGNCPRCDAAVDGPGARHCDHCGQDLAAVAG